MGISSKFCYMQKADISEILTPPRTPPESSILVRNIVIIEFLGLTGNRIIETGNGIILTNQSERHFPVGYYRFWNFVNSSILARDIVIIVFLGQTGNRIIETGNGIILTFHGDGHFPVDGFRLWNFVNSPFLARDIIIIGFLG